MNATPSEYAHLPSYFAKKYATPTKPYAILLERATASLQKAMRTFDAKKHTSLSSFAYQTIQTDLVSFLKAAR